MELREAQGMGDPGWEPGGDDLPADCPGTQPCSPSLLQEILAPARRGRPRGHRVGPCSGLPSYIVPHRALDNPVTAGEL